MLKLGILIRDCTWQHRNMGSGKRAYDCLIAAYTILDNICRASQSDSPYLTSLRLAIMLWDEFHDELPGCCFMEEKCEALISKLAKELLRDLTLNTQKDYNAAWCMLGLNVSKVVKFHHGYKAGSMDILVDRVKLLVEEIQTSNLRYVTMGAANPDRHGRKVKASLLIPEMKWPDDFKAPKVLGTDDIPDTLLMMQMYNAIAITVGEKLAVDEDRRKAALRHFADTVAGAGYSVPAGPLLAEIDDFFANLKSLKQQWPDKVRELRSLYHPPAKPRAKPAPQPPDPSAD